MEFGKRTQASLLAALRRGQIDASRRRMARTAIAGLLLGFGGITAGTSLVQASEQGGLLDFFGQLFGQPSRPVEIRPSPEARRAPRHYSSLPDARRITATRQRHFTPRPVPLAGIDGLGKPARNRGHNPMQAATHGVVQPATGPQSVCVRTCDGYMFPLGALRAQKDVPLHQAACAAACPDAPTALYTLPWGKSDLDQIVSLKGQPYLAAAWANVYRQKRVANCHCRTPGSVAAPLSVEHDPTLRVGDVVATRESAAVVTRLARGDVTLEDYRGTRRIGRGERHAIDLRIGALQRDADDRHFKRSLRRFEAADERLRIAEAKFTRIRHESAGRGFGGTEPGGRTEGPGFLPVRVLVPSPFER